MISLTTIKALQNILNSDRFTVKGNERRAIAQIEAELVAEEARLKAPTVQSDSKGGTDVNAR